MERKYKDRLFRLLFSGERELLSLYNAVNGTSYTNPEELEINTLENAVYMNMKNDISFVFDFSLNLYEHQSTLSPNLPLRNLFYLSRVLQRSVKDDSLYGRRAVRIPAPRFIVFYNGTEKAPERMVLRLSDAFEQPMEEPEVELKVTMLNINPGYNRRLLEGCPLLKEYMLYVEKVRSYSRKQPVERAVEQAVAECIREGILAEFLSRYRAEAIEVSIFEYNEEEHMKLVRAEGWEDGWEDGRRKGWEEGRQEGRQEGREEGREEGRQEGIMQERGKAQKEIDRLQEENRKLRERLEKKEF